MAWGAEQDYPGDNFEYHLKPFRAAVDAGIRTVMPSYGKPMGTQFEEVAMAYNKEVLEGVLRKDLGFTGVVVSDWCILEGFPESGEDALAAKAWGVEHLSLEQLHYEGFGCGSRPVWWRNLH
jgi:beta-glucosidase